MRKGGLIAAIFSVLVVGVLTIVLYCTWPAIKASINKSKYYSSEQVQEAYDKGYNDGIKNETELNAQIEYYKNLTDEYYVQIVDYQKQVDNFKQSVVALQNNIESLNSLKAENEQTILSLKSVNESNQQKIDELSSQVKDLDAKKSELEQQLKNSQISVSNYEQQVASLNSQIATSQALIEQLKASNSSNLELINSLNSQILSLNTQISELNAQIQSNSSIVAGLNKKIDELEKSIKYYESYVKTLESGEKVVVTFEFDGSVINVQVVSKGTKVSIVDPQSTDYVIFNYWTVGGDKITLSDYTINDSVTIVANVTYKFDVKFIADDQQKGSQIVEKDHFATAPSNPSKEGYEFDGWTINGNDVVDVSSYKITETTTFIAKFTKLHTVTFLYESETKSTQKVRNGEYAQNVNVDNTDYKVFNGWTLNGVKVDVTSYKITTDTVFVADLTYKYDVIFMVDSSQHNKQIIAKDHFAAAPSNPSKEGYEFDGWTINGNDIVNVATYKIVGPTTFIAKLTKLHTVKFMSDEQVVFTQQVRHGEYASLPTAPSKVDYDFVGWGLDNESSIDVSSFIINDDITFHALFKLNVVYIKVAFDGAGGAFEHTFTVKKGSTMKESCADDKYFNYLLNAVVGKKCSIGRMRYFFTYGYECPTQLPTTSNPNIQGVYLKDDANKTLIDLSTYVFNADSELNFYAPDYGNVPGR